MANKTNLIETINELTNKVSYTYELPFLQSKTKNELTKLIAEINFDIKNNLPEEESVDEVNPLAVVNPTEEEVGDDGSATGDGEPPKVKEVIVEEVWNFEQLSPNDKRLYQRTGIKRVSKTNNYTRFGVEKPKI